MDAELERTTWAGISELLIGKDKSLFNDEPVEVVRAGNDINFIGKLVLPFGVLSLDFNGTIDGTAWPES